MDGGQGQGGQMNGNGPSSVQGTRVVGGLPVIDIATYANTDVYECYVRGQESRILMRRCKNDWINMTQVFKIANFSKAQRTKILEKEATNMEHEKVQGGYGRFQGTWVPLSVANMLVEKYKVENPVVQTLLEFKLDPMNPPLKRTKNSILRKSSPGAKIFSPSSYNKTPKKPNNGNTTSSSTATAKLAKKSHSLQVNPSPLQNLVYRTPRRPSNSDPQAPDTDIETTIAKDDPGSVIKNNNNNSYLSKKNDLTPMGSNGYASTQKPLQFFHNKTGHGSIGTFDSSNNNNNHNPSYQGTNSNKNSENSSFLRFVSVDPNSSSNTNLNQNVPMITINNSKGLNNTFDSKTHITKNQFNIDTQKKRKRKEFGSTMSFEKENKFVFSNPSEMQTPEIDSNILRSTQDKTQQAFNAMKKRQRFLQQPGDHQDDKYFQAYNLENANILQGYTNHARSLGTSDSETSTLMPQSAPNVFTVLSHEDYKDLLLQVLSEDTSSNTDDYVLPRALYTLPAGYDLNQPIDDQGHTALHWATAMANVPLVKLLLGLGSHPLSLNNQGFNSITKSVFYNNCYKTGVFLPLLEILKNCLVSPDANGRLPIHYLVELSVNKSKDPEIINSYLFEIINFLGNNDNELLKTCLNYPDIIGNTPLHLSALNLNIPLCNKLCSVGASTELTNIDNETPLSILNKHMPMMNSVTHNGNTHPLMSSTKQNSILNKENTIPDDLEMSSSHNSHLELSGNTDLKRKEGRKSIAELNDRNSKNNRQSSIISINGDANLLLAKAIATPNSRLLDKENLNLSVLQDSATFNSMMDDLSNVDSLVSGSLIKDMKPTPSKALMLSPIQVRHPRTSSPTWEGNSGTTTAQQYSIGMNPKSPMPLTTLIRSPIELDNNTSILKSNTNSNVDGYWTHMARRISSISEDVSNAIRSEIGTTENNIKNAERSLNDIREHIKVNKNKIGTIISQINEPNVNSTDDLEVEAETLKHQVETNSRRLVQCVEKSQALSLANLVQKEEYKVKEHTSDDTTKNDPHKLDDLLTDAINMTILQFKRRALNQKMIRKKCMIKPSAKIKEYKKLLGLNLDDLDSKLDDIEKDLVANT